MSQDSRSYYAKVAVTVAAVAVILILVRLLFWPVRTGSAEVISWDDAGRHIDRYCTVEGRIVGTYNSGKACFLNFHPDYAKHFSAVIFAGRYAYFPPTPEQYYLHRRVRVTGMVKAYKGRPEIVLESSGQIQILE